MSALQLWLQNHNRKLTQDAIDEALMEYITHVEKQRDELLAALEGLASKADELCRWDRRFDDVLDAADTAIASVKGDAA